MIRTRNAEKAGSTDWRAHVYIDDNSDVFRCHIGTRRFPTAPLARAWVTRQLTGTVPLEPEHLAWGAIEQFRWEPVSDDDPKFGWVDDAEPEPIEGTGRYAYKAKDGQIVWDDPAQAVGC